MNNGIVPIFLWPAHFLTLPLRYYTTDIIIWIVLKRNISPVVFNSWKFPVVEIWALKVRHIPNFSMFEPRTVLDFSQSPRHLSRPCRLYCRPNTSDIRCHTYFGSALAKLSPLLPSGISPPRFLNRQKNRKLWKNTIYFPILNEVENTICV